MSMTTSLLYFLSIVGLVVSCVYSFKTIRILLRMLRD